MLLEIEAGRALNPKTGDFEYLSLPFGAATRLAIIHINNKSIKKKTKEISIGSLSSFARKIWCRQPGGKDLKSLKQAFMSLSFATFRFGLVIDEKKSFQIDNKIFRAAELEFNEGGGWPEKIILSDDYFNSLKNNAVPLDMKHVMSFQKSAFALDIYNWLAHRLHRVQRHNGDFIPWAALFQQFAAGGERMVDFRRNFLVSLKSVLAVYSTAKVEEEFGKDGRPKGLKIYKSPPPIPIPTDPS